MHPPTEFVHELANETKTIQASLVQDLACGIANGLCTPCGTAVAFTSPIQTIPSMGSQRTLFKHLNMDVSLPCCLALYDSKLRRAHPPSVERPPGLLCLTFCLSKNRTAWPSGNQAPEKQAVLRTRQYVQGPQREHASNPETASLTEEVGGHEHFFKVEVSTSWQFRELYARVGPLKLFKQLQGQQQTPQERHEQWQQNMDAAMHIRRVLWTGDEVNHCRAINSCTSVSLMLSA